jgi:hypothetical protein
MGVDAARVRSRIVRLLPCARALLALGAYRRQRVPQRARNTDQAAAQRAHDTRDTDGD